MSSDKASGKTQIIVAIIALSGVLIVGWWQFGSKSEQHVYAINVKDVATMKPVEHAKITLAWPSHNELRPAGSDGAASFQVLTKGKSIRAHVYVEADGYNAQDRDVVIPSEDSNDIFTLARLEAVKQPPRDPISRTFNSGTVLSGVMKDWSPWYIVQAEPPPPGYEIDLDQLKTRYEVSGDRNCNSWGLCEWVEHSAKAASFRFKLQGHDERPYPGQVPAIGYLYVTYKPVAP